MLTKPIANGVDEVVEDASVDESERVVLEPRLVVELAGAVVRLEEDVVALANAGVEELVVVALTNADEEEMVVVALTKALVELNIDVTVLESDVVLDEDVAFSPNW